MRVRPTNWILFILITLAGSLTASRAKDIDIVERYIRSPDRFPYLRSVFSDPYRPSLREHQLVSLVDQLLEAEMFEELDTLFARMSPGSILHTKLDKLPKKASKNPKYRAHVLRNRGPPFALGYTFLDSPEETLSALAGRRTTLFRSLGQTAFLPSDFETVVAHTKRLSPDRMEMLLMSKVRAMNRWTAGNDWSVLTQNAERAVQILLRNGVNPLEVVKEVDHFSSVGLIGPYLSGPVGRELGNSGNANRLASLFESWDERTAESFASLLPPATDEQTTQGLRRLAEHPSVDDEVRIRILPKLMDSPYDLEGRKITTFRAQYHDGSYLSPNEATPSVVSAFTRDVRGGSAVVVGTDRSYMACIVIQCEYLFQTDIDDSALRFNQINNFLLRISEDRESYRRARVEMSYEEIRRLAGSRYQRQFEEFFTPDHFEWWKIAVRSEPDFKVFHEPPVDGDLVFHKSVHYLHDDRAFEHVKQLVDRGRVVPVPVDLRDPSSSIELARHIDTLGENGKVSMLNLSNVPGDDERFAKSIRNFEGRVAPNAVSIRTGAQSPDFVSTNPNLKESTSWAWIYDVEPMDEEYFRNPRSRSRSKSVQVGGVTVTYRDIKPAPARAFGKASNFGCFVDRVKGTLKRIRKRRPYSELSRK